MKGLERQETSDCPSGVCAPTVVGTGDSITVAHGGGGKLMHDLISNGLKILSDVIPEDVAQHDSVFFKVDEMELAFTTDSFVVSPITFPGGDIGKLAVYGTTNDLVVAGAEPMYLSLALIIEEGMRLDELEHILESIASAAKQVGVKVVTGDTKVVEKGKGDKVFVNTSGIGLVRRRLTPSKIRDGDVIVLSGDVGRHGIAIMAARGEIAFEIDVESDCAPLKDPIMALIDEGVDLRCARDLTRGGLASALNELASVTGLGVELVEDVPVMEPVAEACEILGLDPLQVACEGRFVAVVGEHDVERAIQVMRRFEVSANAVPIGRFTSTHDKVLRRTPFGTMSLVEMPTGYQLPRIC